MDSNEFLTHRDSAIRRRESLLIEKEKEYSNGLDRFDQFYRAGYAQNILPTEALIGMMAKHFISITDMAKSPLSFTPKQWHSKLDDLANYCDLLDALVHDIDENEEEE
jgi:hypothetical protein